MNTPNIILAAKANSGKSTNNVWVVYTSADTANKMYCTSAYKAMRLAFLLKKRLGIGISENSFAIAAALGIAQASLALLSFARYLPRTPVARDCTHQGSHGCPSAAGGEARAAAHARKAQEERAQAKGRKGGLGRASTSARLERVGLSFCRYGKSATSTHLPPLPPKALCLTSRAWERGNDVHHSISHRQSRISSCIVFSKGDVPCYLCEKQKPQ